MGKTVEQQMEECTHNCMTCMSGCAEGDGGPSKLEQTLYDLSDIEADDLLKALEEFGE